MPPRLAVAKALAEERRVTINEVVLAYLLSQPNQTIPIFGGSNPEQIEESIKSIAVKLTSAEFDRLRVG